MINRRVAGACVALLCLSCVATAGAQTPPKAIEIGMDGQALVTTGDTASVSLRIPASVIRVGFPLSDRAQLEPAASLYFAHAGSDNVSEVALGAGVLWNFSQDRTRPQWYARPFVNLPIESGYGITDYQAELGAGIGLRLPMTSMLSWRFEAHAGHYFARNGHPPGTEIGFSFGLSAWTK